MAAKLPITEDRKRRFVDIYEATFSFAEACRAVSPHCEGGAHPPAYSTWQRLKSTDPAFARQLEAADERRCDLIRQEILNRAVYGTPEPVVQGGRIVTQKVVDAETGEEERVPVMRIKKSDAVLIRLAQAILPEFVDRKEINVNVRAQTAGLWDIMAEDLHVLSADQRDQLKGILTTVRTARRAQAALPVAAEVEEPEPEDTEESEYNGYDNPVPY